MSCSEAQFLEDLARFDRLPEPDRFPRTPLEAEIDYQNWAQHTWPLEETPCPDDPLQ